MKETLIIGILIVLLLLLLPGGNELPQAPEGATLEPVEDEQVLGGGQPPVPTTPPASESYILSI